MSTSNAIVLPIDFSKFSEAALPWARRIAALTGGEIHCVFCVEPPQIYAALEMGAAIPIPTTDDLTENATERLTKFVAQNLAGQDAKAVTKVLSGRPAMEIVDYANEIDAAMIIMTTHGYSGLEHMLLGSTTESVLRQANCPVLSVRQS